MTNLDLLSGVTSTKPIRSEDKNTAPSSRITAEEFAQMLDDPKVKARLMTISMQLDKVKTHAKLLNHGPKKFY